MNTSYSIIKHRMWLILWLLGASWEMSMFVGWTAPISGLWRRTSE